MNPWGHFKTITYHKLLVMLYCFQVGLIRQGLLHDLSKYSLTEFRIGAKYYSGTHSPNASEREEIGYSTAWLHHKGRNKHHLEYWMDYGGKDYHMVGQPMPTKYMVELCMDRISACRVYHGKRYTDKDPLEYFNRSHDAGLMHPITRGQVLKILTMLADMGKKDTFRYIRNVVLKHPVRCYTNLPAKSDHPEEKDNSFLSGKAAIELGNQYKTPFYLYDEKTIRENCRLLKETFSWNSGYRQFFPVKATPTPAILKILQAEGQGVVCSSAAELELCSRCGFSPDEILFMPNYPTEDDLNQAAKLSCRVLLDGPGLVNEYARRGMLRDGIGLRINPGGVFRFGGSEVRLDEVKFGFSLESAKECIKCLKQHGIHSIGIHSYLAGNTLEPSYFPAIAEKLIEVSRWLINETSVSICYIDISGGLGIPYRPEDVKLDINEIGDHVRHVFETQTTGTELNGISLFTEVGRWITGPAGLLITAVNHVRRGTRNFVGVDASASNLMRPMMYQSYHHISVAGRELDRQRDKWDVVGTVCENTDKFAADRLLPDIRVGDILKIHDVGAHGYSMGYQYGGRLRCAEYLMGEDGRIRKIRRAETPEDYFQTMVF